MRWQQHWACLHQYGISQEQMPSKCPDREARKIKVMRLEDSRSRRRMRMTSQDVGDDQRAEMRGGKKGATANIVTGVATAAEAAAGRGIGSIAGEIETTKASRPHGVAIGATGAGAVAGMRTIADDTGITGPREAEAAAGNIGGRREMDSVEDLLMGGVSVLNADEMIDRCRKHTRPKQANRTTFGGHAIFMGRRDPCLERPPLSSAHNVYEKGKTSCGQPCTRAFYDSYLLDTHGTCCIWPHR